MTVEIWSDVMCPFCYLGKRNFEAAIEQFTGKEKVEVEWKSFQLNPALGTEGMSTLAYLSQMRGMQEEQVRASFEGIRLAGAEKGLTFHFDKTVVTNTAAAHRLIQLAKAKGKGDEAEELLFKAHFTDGLNVSDPQVLAGVGKELGLSAAEVESAQEDPRYQEGLDKDLYEARQIGVRGVPFFVFDRKYAVSGAQPVEVFLQTLERSEAESESPEGNSCTVDGNCN